MLNRGRVIHIPSTGRQKDFQQQFSEILKTVSVPCTCVASPSRDAPRLSASSCLPARLVFAASATYLYGTDEIGPLCFGFVVMRLIAVGAVAFIFPAFMTAAQAQQRVVAPAPQFSAPAPYIAPRFVVPNAAAPTAPISHLAAPNIAAPQFAAPHISTPHDDRWATPGTIGIVGHDPDSLHRNPEQSAPTEAPNINPALILRNPAFAGLSSRNPAIRSLSRSTFGGNFAQSDFARAWDRPGPHRHFGFVLGFVGPPFWPYAFEDLNDYTFSPYAYDAFWPYAFDDVFAGIYGGYAPDFAARTAATLTDSNSQICSGQAQGLTDFPIERIAKQVGPDQYQQTLLDDLKAATAKAVSILQAACPSELPSTPTGRIAAMRTRVEAMLQAVQLARLALDKFYQSLSDEQKERFNVIDQDVETTGQRQAAIAALCRRAQRDPRPLLDRTERILRLSSDQGAALKDLIAASAKAADILKASCQSEQPITPTGRLAAMEERLNAILQVLESVQAPLEKFYDSLSDEQKARFNRLGAPTFLSMPYSSR